MTVTTTIASIAATAAFNCYWSLLCNKLRASMIITEFNPHHTSMKGGYVVLLKWPQWQLLHQVTVIVYLTIFCYLLWCTLQTKTLRALRILSPLLGSGESDGLPPMSCSYPLHCTHPSLHRAGLIVRFQRIQSSDSPKSNAVILEQWFVATNKLLILQMICFRNETLDPCNDVIHTHMNSDRLNEWKGMGYNCA